MQVKEVANLSGVSVRTLHHYDAIGLLVPDQVSEAGYRQYSDENLATLQQILFFKELGFSLKRIKELLDSPSFERREAFEMQRAMLVKKRRRVDEMIQTIDKTIQYEKGAIQMTNEERFKGFDFTEGNAYEAEARERWGDEAVDQANRKAEDPAFGEEMNRIYFKLAEIRHLDPASKEAQEVIGEWYDFLITKCNFPKEGFAGLGQMYVTDERFTKNIDQFGEGLARFMCEAMRLFSENGK